MANLWRLSAVQLTSGPDPLAESGQSGLVTGSVTQSRTASGGITRRCGCICWP